MYVYIYCITLHHCKRAGINGLPLFLAKRLHCLTHLVPASGTCYVGTAPKTDSPLHSIVALVQAKLAESFAMDN